MNFVELREELLKQSKEIYELEKKVQLAKTAYMTFVQENLGIDVRAEINLSSLISIVDKITDMKAGK